MRILIATPTAGGITTTAYTQSVVAATVAIHEMGGTYRHLSIDGADVVIARNILAHSFLTDDSCDYVLFIDSDMAVDLAVFAESGGVADRRRVFRTSTEPSHLRGRDGRG